MSKHRVIRGSGAPSRRQGKDDRLVQKIEAITRDIAAHFSRRLKEIATSGGSHNIDTLCNYIIAEQNEINIKPSTKEGKIKVLLRLSGFHKHRPFEQLTKTDILAYLNSLRKPQAQDPSQKWVGTYNGRQMIFMKFFRWLYNPDEPDIKRRVTPPCMVGVRQLPRKDKSPYKPSDLWSAKEHAVFLKYCPSKRDRCYHAMDNDTSARPHELLSRKVGDVIFKQTDEGIQYAEILIQDGKTGSRTLPIIDSLPYLKDYLQNEHPCPSNPNAWLFVSLAQESFGEKLRRDGLWDRYQRFYRKNYFPKLLKDETVPEADKAIIRNMLTKPWNPYVHRHSALTEKSQLLTESTLRDHAGWTMTSKMPAVYLHYYGTESANKLLEAKGIIRQGGKNFNVLRSKPCPHCGEPNTPEAQFCAKCRMVLSYDSYRDTLERKQKRELEITAVLNEVNLKYEKTHSLLMTMMGSMASADEDTRKKIARQWIDSGFHNPVS